MRQDEIAKNDLSSYISDCPSINEKQNFKSDPGTVTPVLPESFRQEYFLTRENQIRVRKLVEFLQSFPRRTELPGDLHQPSPALTHSPQPPGATTRLLLCSSSSSAATLLIAARSNDPGA